MSKLFAALVVTGLATFATTGAQAAVVIDCGCAANPLSGAFAVSIWSGPQTSQDQQALPSNPLVSAAYKVGSGTYTGAIDFDYNTNWWYSPTVSGFFRTGDGSYAGTGGSTAMSSLSGKVTLIEFSFTTTQAKTNLTFTHNDGVSLFAAGSSTDLLAVSAAGPTSSATTRLASLAAGTYNMWFVSVNGNQPELCIDDPSGGTTTVPPSNVPEPATLSVLGAGLLALGFVRRRRD